MVFLLSAFTAPPLELVWRVTRDQYRRALGLFSLAASAAVGLIQLSLILS